MRRLRRLPGFHGRIGRLAYVGCLAAAYAVSWGYTALVEATGLRERSGSNPMTWLGLALLIGMIWLVVCLNARRLRDAGANPWWGVFPFAFSFLAPGLAPFLGPVGTVAVTGLVNTAFVLVLSVLPRRAPAVEARTEHGVGIPGVGA